MNINFILKFITQRRGDAKNAEFKRDSLFILNLFIPFAPSAPPGALLRLKPSRFYSSCRIFMCATPCRLCSSTPLCGAYLGGLCERFL